MINVKLYYNGYKIEGHADFAVHGQDIVCAGVSAVNHMIAKKIKSIKNTTVKIRPGYTMVKVHALTNILDILLEMFDHTMLELEEAYPNHIKVEECEAWLD